MSKYPVDTYVRKNSGAFWEGTVVGHYSTEQTPDGVAVQLFGWPNGPVQIYPTAALEACPKAGTMGSRSPKLGASFETVAAAYAQDERAALGIEAAFLAGAKFGAMRAANECLAALPMRQDLETGEAMSGNASETAGAPAPPPSPHVERFNPAEGSPATADQMAAVMLLHGTPEQQREALNPSPQTKTMDDIHREQLDRPRLKPASPQTNVGAVWQPIITVPSDGRIIEVLFPSGKASTVYANAEARQTFQMAYTGWRDIAQPKAIKLAPDPTTKALEEIKYLALTAGAPDYTPTPDALRRIIWLCRQAGVTKSLDELGEYSQGRVALAPTEGK